MTKLHTIEFNTQKSTTICSDKRTVDAESMQPCEVFYIGGCLRGTHGCFECILIDRKRWCK